MTRINLVPPEHLSRQHLLAEYRELPRVFGLAYRASQRGHWWAPDEYTLGEGHVRFFYDKLQWVWLRYKQLCDEMRNRGYAVNVEPFEMLAYWSDRIPKSQWQNWTPSEVEIPRSVARLNERLAFRSRVEKHYRDGNRPQTDVAAV